MDTITRQCKHYNKEPNNEIYCYGLLYVNNTTFSFGFRGNHIMTKTQQYDSHPIHNALLTLII